MTCNKKLVKRNCSRFKTVGSCEGCYYSSDRGKKKATADSLELVESNVTIDTGIGRFNKDMYTKER